jgi:hypothetical protein
MGCDNLMALILSASHLGGAVSALSQKAIYVFILSIKLLLCFIVICPLNGALGSIALRLVFAINSSSLSILYC